MRIVVDTDVIVSGLRPGESPPTAVLDAWIDGAFELVSSPPLMVELLSVLRRPRIRAFLGQPAPVIDAFVRQLRRNAIIVEPARRIAASRDPDDDRVIEAAVAGAATFIVTGDTDLLALGAFEGIAIVTPGAFLERIEAEYRP